MNRHDRRAARAFARRQPQPFATADQVADRQHMLTANLKDIERLSASTLAGQVIVVCDTRDPVGRDWVKAAGMTEGDILRLEARMMGRCIPTAILAMPIEPAAALAAWSAPTVSEELERRAGDEGCRLVLVVASAMVALAEP